MLKKILLGLMFAIFATAVYAQKPGGSDEGSADMLSALDHFRMTEKGKPTEEEVGDADSFGRAQTYLGVAQTQAVFLDPVCDPLDFGPDDICIVTNPAPASTSVDEADLGTLELPKNASKSILCFTFTQFSTWVWGNGTGSTQTGNMSLYTTVQIENAALNGLTDSEGNPFGGFVFHDEFGNSTPTGIIVSTSQSTLPAGASELQRERTTRACTGGIVSANSLRAQGLTDNQVKDFFKEPMTITFGTQGSTRMTDFVQFFAGIRIYGDK